MPPVIAALCCLLLSRVELSVSQDVASGDNCGSGQEFPVQYEGTVFVGCDTFDGEQWYAALCAAGLTAFRCRREDGTLVTCPPLPLADEASETAADAPASSANRQHISSPGRNVVISELMAAQDLFTDDDAETSDWIELHNGESETVSLEGWALTDDRNAPRKWPVPAISIDAGAYAIVFASGKDRVTSAAAHANFRLSDRGEYLALVRPDGSVASAVENAFPQQIPNVSYGFAGFDGKASDTEVMTFLSEPTPGEPNSGPMALGPFIESVEHEHEGEMQPAGKDIVVTAVVAKADSAIEDVTLSYSVMFRTATEIPMQSGRRSSAFTASIPSSAFEPGQMVRWFVRATDSGGGSSTSPSRATDDAPQFHGTVIASSIDTALPVLYWFTDDAEASISIDGHQSSVFFEGEFYDNVFTRRRGVTALAWRKPKIKFDFKGAAFRFQEGADRVEEFNLQSFFDEVGEDSYMREPIAFQIHREAGVPASTSFHVHVQQNNQYFGLFAFVEQVDSTFLEVRCRIPPSFSDVTGGVQRNGYNIGGNLFKSVHGQFSNLRWDVKLGDLEFTYSKGNKIGVDNWQSLWDLTQGLAGGGAVSRSAYLYDFLNLPEVINYMAVSNLLLNQDRCTKNFYVYEDPVSLRWSIFPWDVEASMGISGGLGGEPAPDYCVLACEQWNSPFYCDSDHPQDLAILQNLVIETGRRLMQVTADRTRPRNFDRPTRAQYDADLTGTASLTGADGTYNHLDDAILDWPETREMYLRRLRTVMDQFLNGRLEAAVKDLYGLISSDAAKDNAKWDVTSQVENGFDQLINEQLPTRRAQLYEAYGPDGLGVIPDGQSEEISLRVVAVEAGASEGQYIEISNPHGFAADISGWRLSGAVDFEFAPGTVIVSKGTLYVTPNIGGFRSRGESPKGGEGHFYVGPCTVMESGISAKDISITNAQA